jgi:TonB family protein
MHPVRSDFIHPLFQVGVLTLLLTSAGYSSPLETSRSPAASGPKVVAKAAAPEPSTFDEFYRRGLAQSASLDAEGAIKSFDGAIALRPGDAEVYYQRGDAKRRLMDYSGALADCDRALALNPKLVLAYVARGAVSHDQAKFADAIADYERALAISPGDPTATFALASSKKALAANVRRAEEPRRTDVFDPSALQEVPRAISQPPPQYPADLFKRGIGGSALIEFIITSTGDVYGPFTVAATRPEFGEAAVNAAKRWKFKPGRIGNRNVNTRVRQQVGFEVKKDAAKK